MSLPDISGKVRTDESLENAEKQCWGRANSGTIREMVPALNIDPYECQNNLCPYGQEVDQIFWEDMPIDSEIVESHRNWVSNRRQWSGVSKYLQESIEPTVNWIGIKPGGIGPPEPVPQNCARAELTEYGPADFETFITTERRRCGDPVIRPYEMAHTNALPFSFYGF